MTKEKSSRQRVYHHKMNDRNEYELVLESQV